MLQKIAETTKKLKSPSKVSMAIKKFEKKLKLEFEKKFTETKIY
jgi:hypothetical protein